MLVKKWNRRQKCALTQATALVAAIATSSVAKGADSSFMITWSVSGSTAMRNFTTGGGFSVLETGDPTLTLANGTYSGGSNGLQLGPGTYTGQPLDPPANTMGAGVRVEWHEQGSVEGILDMANDQIGYAGGFGAPTTSFIVDPTTRNPTSGNPIWVNRNKGIAVGAIGSSGYSIATSTYNTYDTSVYNAGGTNLQGGQNRVQMAISDVPAIEGFSVTGTPTGFTTTIGTGGYGKGNPALVSNVTNGLGIVGGRQALVDHTLLNMPTNNIDPATGSNYAAGSWNTNGVANLISKTVAVTATVMAANPGTGLTDLNRGDAQWLQAAGRLQNGADFNVSERDVNSGTRNVFALNTGVDGSWAVGDNDGGNGNPGNPIGSAASQASIGPNMRFSGKTSGGSQLRPTVQNNRMALGPLGMSDAIGAVKSNTNAFPLRALAYSDTATDVGANFVQPNASTITDGSYVIWQQEQYVNVRTPDSNYNNDNSIKGDNSNGDIAQLRNNILNSVNATFPNQASLNTPADQLIFNSFILPQMMLVAKPLDGNSTTDVSNVVVNGQTHATWRNDLLGDPATLNFATLPAASVTSGSGSNYGVANGVGSLAAGAVNVPITAQDNTGNSTGAASAPMGNYLFGNFNQTGVRDYSAIIAGQVAEARLFNAGSVANGNVSGGTIATDVNNSGGIATFTNSTKINTLVGSFGTALDTMNSSTGPSKGDLIVMGDYNGDGKFDGKDLYYMARGAAIADNNSSTILTATAANFGDKVRGGVLRKNAALDAMQAATTPVGGDIDGFNAARAYQRVTASANLTNDPTGANAFNKFDVNRDGLVTRQDAQLVDYFMGKDYRSLTDQLNAVVRTDVNSAGSAFVDANGNALDATSPANLAIPRKPISLVDVELNDTGNIDRSDFNLIRAAEGSSLLAGDTNFDGVVDIRDLFNLAQHYNQSFDAAHDKWSVGDFNGDGVVDAADLGMLAADWQQSAGGLSVALSNLGLPTSVPEPGSIGLLAMGIAPIFLRRRRGK